LLLTFAGVPAANPGYRRSQSCSDARTPVSMRASQRRSADNKSARWLP